MHGRPFLIWICFIGILSIRGSTLESDSILADKRSSVTFARCRLQGMVTRSYFIGLIRVNDTLKERRQSIENGQLLCSIHSDHNKDQRYIVLDMFLNGDPPSNLSLQIADKFLPDLQFSTIVCSYTNIGSGSRINGTMPVKSLKSSENGNYVCNETKSQIIFTGIPLEVSPDSEHERSKRSIAQKETPVSEIKCYKSYNITKVSDRPFKLLGDACKVEHGIAFRWMIDPSGLPDCLTCCKNHFYDTQHQRCGKCSPTTTQPTMNVWPHCEPASEHSPTATPTSMPMSPVSSTQLTSSKAVKTTDPEPKITPPAEAPTGINVTEAGYDFALIEWDEVPSHENAPVSFYKVAAENLVNNHTVPPERVEGSKTWAKLTKLNPGSYYEVKVQAGNSAGFGPTSDIIDVHTLRKLDKLQDINFKTEDSLVTFNWTAKPKDRDLTAKVEYWLSQNQPENARATTKPYSNGEIDFRLPSNGTFNMRVFYTDESGDGPTSELFTVDYQEADRTIHCPGCTARDITVAGIICFLIAPLCGIIIVFIYSTKRYSESSLLSRLAYFTMAAIRGGRLPVNHDVNLPDTFVGPLTSPDSDE